MTFKSKIIGIILCFALILIAGISSNLYAYSQIDYNTKQIYDVESLRMRSYKITLFANQFSISNKEVFKNGCEEEIIKVFYEFSSLKLHYKSTDQKEISDKLDKAFWSWESMFKRIESSMAGPLNANEMSSVTIEADKFVKGQIDPLLSDIKDYYQNQIKFFKIIQVIISSIFVMLIVFAGIYLLKANNLASKIKVDVSK